MVTKTDIAKVLLKFGHDSPADREFAIRENRENGELVAIVRTMASNGSEAGPATLQILVLEDSTPDE